MNSSSSSDRAVTQLLQAVESGDKRAFDELYACIYEQLRRLARQVRRDRAGETLCTTALVHEAYLKLVPSAEIRWRSRSHFYAVAARAMRQVLTDAARRRAAEKRPNPRWAVTFEEGMHAVPVRPDELLALDEALERLSGFDERQARVVEHRFFAGLKLEETAEVLGLSVPTVHREWRLARAWLAQQMNAAEA